MVCKAADMVQFVSYPAALGKVPKENDVQQLAPGTQVVKPRLNVGPTVMDLLDGNIPVLKSIKATVFGSWTAAFVRSLAGGCSNGVPSIVMPNSDNAVSMAQ